MGEGKAVGSKRQEKRDIQDLCIYAPVQDFTLSLAFLGLACKTGSHPGISLVGASGATGRWMPVARTPGQHG